MFHSMRKSKPGYAYDTTLPGHPVVKERAGSRGVTSNNETRPETGAPHAPNPGINITQNETYKQVIGKKGAAQLDAADAGNRIDNLGVARKMEKAGKDARAIWFATGWARGTEGEWRYEVMDG